MSKFTNRFAGLATLALAALPMTALVSTAHAATYRVPVADLNLASPADAAKFHARVRMAANAICSGEAQLSMRAACTAAVREEAQAKLSTRQQTQLASATAGALSVAAR